MPPESSSVTQNRPAIKRNLMTIEEVASELNCSVRHVNNLKRRGCLKFFSHGKKMVRFHRSSLERYVEKWTYNCGEN